MYSNAPSISLPNFVDFIDCVTDKKTVNDMSLHTMATKKTLKNCKYNKLYQ